jgi:hypothetical protein
MFCCDGFRNLIGEAGQRGMSVLVYERPGGFRFYLQSRAVSKTDEVRLAEIRAPLPVEGNITLAATMAVRFCPICGTELRRLVTPSTLRKFRALAEDHKKIDERPC